MQARKKAKSPHLQQFQLTNASLFAHFRILPAFESLAFCLCEHSRGDNMVAWNIARLKLLVTPTSGFGLSGDGFSGRTIVEMELADSNGVQPYGEDPGQITIARVKPA